MERNTGFELYGIFRDRYQDAHGDRDNSVSVYYAAGMMRKIADDVGVQGVKDLIDYYFNHRDNHEFMWFAYNYHYLLDDMRLREKDLRKRERLREVTKKRIQELGISLESNLEKCPKCGGVWEREQKKGRPFKYCPDCRRGSKKSQEERQLTLKED